MGARLNRIDQSDFKAAPVLFVDKLGREYTAQTGAPRKIPRDVRKQLYQLHLTMRECEAEIRAILDAHGIKTKNSQWQTMRRIRRERGA